MELTGKIKNQFRKRVLNSIIRYRLRRTKLSPIQNIIFSENSSEHWQLLKVNGLNVLDLGCGRYLVNNITESSPVYFKTKNAKKIVGVDSNKDEVDFFNQYFAETYHDDSLFIKAYIKNSKQLSYLIREHSINAIKCDIEGAEVYLFKLKLQDLKSVQHLSIEYHSTLLLKELLHVNDLEWKFKLVDHSIFSRQRDMGVLTLSRVGSE